MKAGRRIGSANEALLREALDHHASATKCIKDVLDSNDGDEPDDDDDARRCRRRSWRRTSR